MVKSHQYGKKFCYNVFMRFKSTKNDKKLQRIGG